MAPTSRDLQKIETHNRLKEVGTKLFSEHGFDDVTVAMLAKEANVSVGSIVVHFGSKAGLLYEIISDQNEAQMARYETDIPKDVPLRERLLAKWRIEYHGDISDPRLLASILSFSWVWPPETEAENLKQRNYWDGVTRAILKDAIERGEISEKADLDAAITALYAIYLWGLRPAIYEHASPEECLERVLPQLDIVLAGL